MAPQEPLHPLRVDNLGGIRKVLRGGSHSSKKRELRREALTAKIHDKSDLFELLVAPLGHGIP